MDRRVLVETVADGGTEPVPCWGKPLKARTLAEITRPQFTTGSYGFGFQFGRPNEALSYGHGGAAPL